jgi:uncharacterized protein HemX
MENNTENHPSPTPPPASSAPSGAVMDVHASPPGSQPLRPNPPVPQSAPKHDEHSGKNHPAAPQPQKGGAPKAAIVVAVLVALSLVAIVVIMFLNSRKESDEQHETDSSEHTTISPATEKDVEDTDQSVDEAVDATDTAEELPEDDLGNQTLGL